MQSAIAQICIELPPINSAPAVGSAPPGWSVWQESPDIISGNGPWPGGGYTVSDVNGVSAAGGTMAMFLHNGGTTITMAEGWQTTLTGLTIGQSYSVSCEWQQATLNGFVTYSGGNLLVTVNGVPSLFTSSGGVTDPWQVATVTFTATATTALYQVRVSEFPSGPGAFYGSFVVVDNYTCSTVPPFSVGLNTGSICAGECFDLQATPTNAVGTVSYAWNNGITSTGPGPISVCPTTTTTYTVTATDGAGTVSTSSSTITVNPGPTVDLGNDTLICNSAPFTLDAGNPGSTYTWNNSSSLQTVNASSNGTYWVEVTNANGCEASDTIDLTFETIAVNLGNDTMLCDGATLLIDAQNSGSTYEWQDGSTNQTFNTSTAGDYWVEVTSPIGCTTADTITLTLGSVTVDLGNDTILCDGIGLVLNAQNAGASYAWQDGSSNQTFTVSSDGTYWVDVLNGSCSNSDTIHVNFIGSPIVDLGADVTSCNLALTLDAQNGGSTFEWQDGSTNQTFNTTSAGTYWVEVTGPNGCASTDSIVLSLGSITVNLGNDTVLCNSSTLVLDAQNAGSNYTWQDGSTNQTLSLSAAGTYWVTVIDAQGCTASDTISVEFGESLASFTYADTVGCAPFSVLFTDLSSTNQGSITQWSWDFGDNSTSTLQNPAHAYTSSSVYTVTLTVTNGLGCSASTSEDIEVNVYNQPLAEFTYNPIPAIVDQDVFFVDQSLNATSWSWDFGDNSTSTGQNPVHTYANSGNFTVTLIVSNEECIDSAAVQVVILEELLYYIPNAFTPDGDEFNQTFQPIFTTGFDAYDFNMRIFNRWGETIFESKDATIGWDGSYNGQLVQTGTYIWTIEFKEIMSDKRHSIVGHVDVLR